MNTRIKMFPSCRYTEDLEDQVNGFLIDHPEYDFVSFDIKYDGVYSSGCLVYIMTDRKHKICSNHKCSVELFTDDTKCPCCISGILRSALEELVQEDFTSFTKEERFCLSCNNELRPGGPPYCSHRCYKKGTSGT